METETSSGGIKGSILGLEGSQRMIESLKKQTPQEPFTIIIKFLKQEADTRNQGEPDKNWDDALGAVTPACCCLEEILKEREPNKESDLEALKKSLEYSVKTGYSNLEQRKAMVEIYLELRGILCPDFPFENFSLEINPSPDH